MLALADSKTRPRTAPLGSRARAILDRQLRGESPFVFPSPRNPSRPRGPGLPFWYRVRREAGIEDVRLHDLRHAFASKALALGEGLPMIGELIGHRQVNSTERYAHLARELVRASTARVADSIGAAILTEQDGGA